jgi:hypothetical protein
MEIIPDPNGSDQQHCLGSVNIFCLNERKISSLLWTSSLTVFSTMQLLLKISVWNYCTCKVTYGTYIVIVKMFCFIFWFFLNSELFNIIVCIPVLPRKQLAYYTRKEQIVTIWYFACLQIPPAARVYNEEINRMSLSVCSICLPGITLSQSYPRCLPSL